MLRKIVFCLVAIALSLRLSVKNISAQELVISGNGSSAESEISIVQTSQTSVQQSSQANIQNNINIIANTGGNYLQGNSGNVGVTTGEIKVESSVENNNINSSIIQEPNCCSENSTSMALTANAESSVNNVNLESGNEVSLTLNQSASITNRVSILADTGNNKLSGNLGDVNIKTGDVKITNKVGNNGINLSKLEIANGKVEASLNIFENGSSSENSIFLFGDPKLSVNTSFWAELLNDVKLSGNSGSNTLSGNNGFVTVETGDIEITNKISNDKINVGGTVIKCCDPGQKGQEPPVTPSLPPPQNGGLVISSANGGNGDGNGNGDQEENHGEGEVLTAEVGGILPVTGDNWLLLATIANIFTFLFGVYLRLRSGRSPAYSFA